MNIIIAGAGKVGFNLAKTLSIGHNVTIIDKNSEALHRIQESLDIMPLRGDVEDSQTYANFTDKDIDLFIAVTNIDNVNLISIVMAEAVLNIDRKFVRLQKQFFHNSDIKSRLGIDTLIFPIQLASKTISSLLAYPKANNVKFFKYTDHKLISVMVSSRFVPQSFQSQHFSIVGIERKKDFFIPADDSVEILPNDLVYFFGREEEIRNICQKLELDTKKEIQKCVVFGGEELGVSIAGELVKIGRDVKLVEENLELCELADEALGGKVPIINSKYRTHDVFEDEDLDSADIFIAATNNDEFNIIKCLEAKESGIKKVVAINNEMEYYNLMHTLGIIVVRGPKISAYNTIIEEVSSTGIVIQKSYCGARAVVFMRKVFRSSGLVNKKVKSLSVAKSKLFYMRNEQLYLFNENIVLQEDDLVVAFCTVRESAKVKQWIYEL
ncbi:NAD-binding protein [Sulfurimonas paralvinellae]|uniref:Potassium transporter n=1 Tax=Sulfurimonas paralvinellae TaxID=317658 RepID=A0A7M1B577_9BACT|nr:NAD-binding protein [Sulfurimonas paralvinellae]QOP44820.1 potassium transporter [Sulfurimonas paralvinellae]